MIFSLRNKTEGPGGSRYNTFIFYLIYKYSNQVKLIFKDCYSHAFICYKLNLNHVPSTALVKLDWVQMVWSTSGYFLFLHWYQPQDGFLVPMDRRTWRGILEAGIKNIYTHGCVLSVWLAHDRLSITSLLGKEKKNKTRKKNRKVKTSYCWSGTVLNKILKNYAWYRFPPEKNVYETAVTTSKIIPILKMFSLFHCFCESEFLEMIVKTSPGV